MPKQPSAITPKHPGGRPTKMTPEVVKKLEEAFAIGATDREACFYADISMQTLYDYQNKHPEFAERKQALKERPVLLARQTVVSNISKDAKLALEYLKAKAKDEFGSRTELTGKDGSPLTLGIAALVKEVSQLPQEEEPL